MVGFLTDIQSTETFKNSDGPRIIVGILKTSKIFEILVNGFAAVAAAATGNEILKESFMELKIDELIMQTLSSQREVCIQSVYDAIRALLTADDNRVVASQVSEKLVYLLCLFFFSLLILFTSLGLDVKW